MIRPPLEWTISDGGSAVALEGALNEAADLQGLAAALTSPVLVFDLSGIKRITSQGVMRWVRFMQDMGGKQVTFRRCSPPVVDQLNCIRNFAGQAKIESVLVPYDCQRCASVVLDEVAVKDMQDLTAKPPSPACPTCGGKCVFEDAFERYFAFTLAK